MLFYLLLNKNLIKFLNKLNMGCNNVKDPNVPTMLCYFETGRQDQADYCIKLRDNFRNEKTINYQIKSGLRMPFSIQFKINGKVKVIQNGFDDSDKALNDSLEKMYSLLR